MSVQLRNSSFGFTAMNWCPPRCLIACLCCSSNHHATADLIIETKTLILFITFMCSPWIVNYSHTPVIITLASLTFVHGLSITSSSVRNSACPLVRDKWLFTRTSKQSVSSYPSDKSKFTTIFYFSLSFYYNAVIECQTARDFTLENRQRSRCYLMSQK